MGNRGRSLGHTIPQMASVCHDKSGTYGSLSFLNNEAADLR